MTLPDPFLCLVLPTHHTDFSAFVCLGESEGTRKEVCALFGGQRNSWRVGGERGGGERGGGGRGGGERASAMIGIRSYSLTLEDPQGSANPDVNGSPSCSTACSVSHRYLVHVVAANGLSP